VKVDVGVGGGVMVPVVEIEAVPNEGVVVVNVKLELIASVCDSESVEENVGDIVGVGGGVAVAVY
jgi:hypothetical protein